MPNLPNWYKSAERKISQKNPEHMLNKITFKSSSLKPLNQIKPNLAGMVPFKIVSDSPTLHSRWLLLLKIEISTIRTIPTKFGCNWPSGF
jgi:hypothetical protein